MEGFTISKENTNENKSVTVKIVDDIMGSGKTTWAIGYINFHADKRFLCVLPTLSECERYKENTAIELIDPEAWGTKWNHFKKLVEDDKNIVTTHALIANPHAPQTWHHHK